MLLDLLRLSCAVGEASSGKLSGMTDGGLLLGRLIRLVDEILFVRQKHGIMRSGTNSSC